MFGTWPGPRRANDFSSVIDQTDLAYCGGDPGIPTQPPASADLVGSGVYHQTIFDGSTYDTSLNPGDLPTGGNFAVCYCANYDYVYTPDTITCNLDIEFRVGAGTLAVIGARGTGTFFCARNAGTCEFDIQGTSRRALALIVTL